jgi:hypothetical protein
MKRSLVPGFQTNLQKKWKYSGLKDGEVWKFDYELLPEEVLIKIAECVTNKKCTGRSSNAIRLYRSTVSSNLNSWVVQKNPIPTDVACRLLKNLSVADRSRLQLSALIETALNGLNTSAAADEPGQITVENSIISVQEFSDEPNLDDSDFEDDYEHRPCSTRLSTIPSLAALDNDDNEEDPYTGFFKKRVTWTQVARQWYYDEPTVGPSALTRFLQKMHRYQPTISSIEYTNKSIPRKAETLVSIKKEDRKYVIRDFTTYDYVLDDFPGDGNTSKKRTSVIDDDVESDSADSDTSQSSLEDVPDEAAPVGLFANPHIATDLNTDGDAELSDADKNNEYFAGGIPDDEDWKDDGEEIGNELKKEEGEWKANQKMVYFGLENILTGTNSAGNIHKASYYNYLRAIALLDPKALTDKMVDRLFPINSEVSPDKCSPSATSSGTNIYFQFPTFSSIHQGDIGRKPSKLLLIYSRMECRYSRLLKNVNAFR